MNSNSFKFDIFENKGVYKLVVVLIIIGFVIFSIFDAKDTMNSTTEELNKKPQLMYESNFDGAENLVVKSGSVDVNVSYGEEFKVSIYARPNASYDVNMNEKTVSVNFDGTSCTVACIGKEKVVVTVPNVSLLNIETIGGSVSVDGISIWEDSYINTKSGKVELGEIENAFIRASSGSGKVSIESNTEGNVVLNVASNSGDIVSK